MGRVQRASKDVSVGGVRVALLGTRARRFRRFDGAEQGEAAALGRGPRPELPLRLG